MPRLPSHRYKPKADKPKSGLVAGLLDKGVILPMRKPRTEPLWKGPEVDGVTQSLLSRFLVCRERFRLLVIEGLQTKEGFNHRLGYGQMWHTCEEALAGRQDWKAALLAYCRGECQKNRTQQEQIEHWYNVCKAQFPVYIDYWAKHQDVVDREPMFQEQKFCIDYTLPSGRVVKLRGKWDSVDLIGKGTTRSVYLQENKSKGKVIDHVIKRQLKFDLQTMLYIVALKTALSSGQLDAKWSRYVGKVRGVRYNVVLRPLSGGKGNIVRKKPTRGAKCPSCKGTGNIADGETKCPKCSGVGRVNSKAGETKESYYSRLHQVIKAAPELFFARWRVELTQLDVDRFEREFLIPLLENLCTWYDYIVAEPHMSDPFANGHNGIHWRHPFGIFNPMDEGGSSDLDAYLETGEETGLTRTTGLFPELQ